MVRTVQHLGNQNLELGFLVLLGFLFEHNNSRVFLDITEKETGPTNVKHTVFFAITVNTNNAVKRKVFEKKVDSS